MSTGPIMPTNPYHIARAYAAMPPRSTQAQPTLPQAPNAGKGSFAAALRPAGASPASAPTTHSAPASVIDRADRVTLGKLEPVKAPTPARPASPTRLPDGSAILTGGDRSTIEQLVAASVPGRATFDVGVSNKAEAGLSVAARDASVLPMYRRPTDRNEVTTVLLVGRQLDMNG